MSRIALRNAAYFLARHRTHRLRIAGDLGGVMRDAGSKRLGVVCGHCKTVIALPASLASARGQANIAVVCPSCAHDALYPRSALGTLIRSEELEWKEPWLVRLWRWLRVPA